MIEVLPGNMSRQPKFITGIIEDIRENPSIYGLPEIAYITMIGGGVAHHVYRIETEKKRFYLKIRGDCFPNIPQIRVHPTEIIYEYKALNLLGSLAPENFPDIIYFNLEQAFIILSDAMPGGVTLEDLLNVKKASSVMLINWGKTLRKIHDVLSSVTESIRENGDNEFFSRKLEHRFGCRNNSILSNLIYELTHQQPRQLILGDTSPKNVGVSDDGKKLVFFDLEDVHRGCVVFDVGYAVGHLLLHNYNNPREAIANIETFFQGYGSSWESLLPKVIAFGTMMYRLDSIIPYSISLSNKEKTKLFWAIEKILGTHDLDRVTWEDLVLKIVRNNKM